MKKGSGVTKKKCCRRPIRGSKKSAWPRKEGGKSYGPEVEVEVNGIDVDRVKTKMPVTMRFLVEQCSVVPSPMVLYPRSPPNIEYRV